MLVKDAVNKELENSALTPGWAASLDTAEGRRYEQLTGRDAFLSDHCKPDLAAVSKPADLDGTVQAASLRVQVRSLRKVHASLFWQGYS